jgi:hypothetical protein
VDAVNNHRKTDMKASWATRLYAVGRDLLRLAVAMRMTALYLSCEMAGTVRDL